MTEEDQDARCADCGHAVFSHAGGFVEDGYERRGVGECLAIVGQEGSMVVRCSCRKCRVAS